MNTPRFTSLALVSLALAAPLFAVNRTWDGEAGNWDFATALNWSGNTVPANNEYGDTAVFGASTSAGAVNLSGGRSINGITFETAGWSLTGASFTNLSKISSAGAGTNTFNLGFQVQYSPTWNVAAGNTLYLANSFYQRDKNVILTGGGTLQVGASITGFTSGNIGVWGLHVQDAVLRLDTGTPYSGSAKGAIFIDDAAARVQLLTSVAGAQSLIGTRIINTTGLDLQVVDIGGGYVEIAAIPEPSTFALFTGAVILAGVVSSRRRFRSR
jgi:hypothetical protein